MIRRKNILISIFLICLMVIFSGCSPEKEILKEETKGVDDIYLPDNEEILLNETNPEIEEDIVELNNIEDIESEKEQEISMFSWSFELANQIGFNTLSEVLKNYNINRIYQAISARNINEPEMRLMVQKLAQYGIETVALTGDKSWVYDGLDEYEKIVDEIEEYNQTVSEANRIKAIALDVEFHRLPEWDENKGKLFERYIGIMKEAKEYANNKELRVVQIIPTMYDDIDHGMFKTFVKNCCDEVSIMNYNKEDIIEDIEYEVYSCDKYGIPVESIFETMPLSEEYGVSEELTYYYEGIETLQRDMEHMRVTYGDDLKLAVHHITTFYKMVTGENVGEVYGGHILEEGQNPGNLILYGEDGSVILATPHWPNMRKGREEFCWLAMGVEEGISYRIEYYDFYDKKEVIQDVMFGLSDDNILRMILDKNVE